MKPVVSSFATLANRWTLPSVPAAFAKLRAAQWQKVMAVSLLLLLSEAQWAGAASAGGDHLAEIKGYLVFKLERLEIWL